jgi:alpha-beta hydrolase superfamily lysophospholipase
MWCGKDSKRGNRIVSPTSELRIEREDGVALAASVTVPERTPAPALVALHGAQPGLRNYPLFEHLHATLPPAGVAVVTFDRRGEGASTGEPSAGRFELLAADAIAVVEAAAALDEIESQRVGLWGISQGGWVAPLASVRSERPAFLVLLSSCGVTPGAQMLYAMQEQVRRAGYGEEAVGQVRELMLALDGLIHGRGDRAQAQRLLEAAQAEPWWELMYLPGSIPGEEEWTEVREELDFEPEPVFDEVRVPTLLFYGEDDEWIPIEPSIDAWRRARGDAVEVVRLPGTRHEPVLESGEVSPLYTDTLVKWLKARS